MAFSSDNSITTTNVVCTDRDFMEGARRFRSEILLSPVRKLMETLSKFATFRPNVRYEEKLYKYDADLEFGNYNPKRSDDLDLTITPRVLKTYFASARREFDPNQYVHTIHSNPTTKGEGLKGVEIARIALNLIASKLGDNLLKYVFNAERSTTGTTSKTLFNGWDTITAREIATGNLTTNQGNLYKFTEAINKLNAVDQLKAFCRAANEFLLEKQNLNLLVPYQVYYDYLDDYKSVTGAIPYNKEFKQYYIEGFDNIHLMPISQKRGSGYLHLTTKDNMLVGFGNNGEEGSLVVEKHDVVELTFFATMFFGLDFEELEAYRMLVGELILDDEVASAIPSMPTITLVDGSTKFKLSTEDENVTLQYSFDAENWTTVAANTETNYTAGATIYARALKVNSTNVYSSVANKATA